VSASWIPCAGPILWVGLGAPKQEKWAQACRHRLNVKVIAPVGGVFGFYTGRIKLPPKWVQKMGLIFDAALLSGGTESTFA
jgi:N-acetylglucosaminyldiphosphoundecaprenol N-acetyl-beta-D-mannosaminyltransferase